MRAQQMRFDIGLLASRLTATVDWIAECPQLTRDRIGLFGASTGAAGALITAADRPALVRAIVSRGGRPDLAWDALPRASAPTLLIVGGNDEAVIRLNQRAAAHMKAPHELEIIPGATHLFKEPGALEKVAELTARWFVTHLGAEQAAPPFGDALDQTISLRSRRPSHRAPRFGTLRVSFASLGALAHPEGAALALHF